MTKILILFSVIFALNTACYGPQEVKKTDSIRNLPANDSTLHYAENEPTVNIRSTGLLRLELPGTKPGETIISHTGFSFVYVESYEQAEWVAYELTKKETYKMNNRTDKFITDPKVLTGTATNGDYSRSGYDRGHLAPAADMGWSSRTMSESFYYSNMSPQVPGFNRGIWKQLEELVRTWAVEYKSVYIVTGPVLRRGLKTIGKNKVAVPEYYYKVILDYTDPGIKAIGFILPNTGSVEPLQHYAVTIDSVEQFTGIDFYPQLPDPQEVILERTATLQSWSWKSSKF